MNQTAPKRAASTDPPGAPVSAVDLAEVRRLLSTGAARVIREAAKLSQAEVAAHIGCESQAVSRWEAGTRSPKGTIAIRYLDLLKELCKPSSDLRAPDARYPRSPVEHHPDQAGA